MFGIGLPEFILIMALALIVVGPDKLPGLAKTVAKQILELKKAANSLKDSLQDELAEEKESLKELTNGFEDVQETFADLNSAQGGEDSKISAPAAAAPAQSPQSEEAADTDTDTDADAQGHPPETKETTSSA